MMIGGARQSLKGHEKCGDAFLWWHDGPRWTICLADGLGHGPDAALAADAALALAETCGDLAPEDVIATADAGIGWSRGAAIAVVQIDTGLRTVKYAGVGNVRGGLFGDTTVRLEGTPGIVGTGGKTPSPQTLSWRDGDVFLLWTDGFSAYLNLDQACLRLKGDPQALAQHVLDRFSTRRDDAGVVCCLLEGSRR